MTAVRESCVLHFCDCDYRCLMLAFGDFARQFCCVVAMIVIQCFILIFNFILLLQFQCILLSLNVASYVAISRSVDRMLSRLLSLEKLGIQFGLELGHPAFVSYLSLSLAYLYMALYQNVDCFIMIYANGHLNLLHLCCCRQCGRVTCTKILTGMKETKSDPRQK